MKNRKGFIKMSNQMYNDWHLVFRLFRYFRPSHIEFRHWENDTWYFWGTSERFEELKKGDCVPEYLAVFTSDGKDNYVIEFQKV